MDYTFTNGESFFFFFMLLRQLDIWGRWGMHFKPFLTLNKNFNLRWFIDLNVKPKTIKLLEENIGDNLSDLRVDKDFLGRAQKS